MRLRNRRILQNAAIRLALFEQRTDAARQIARDATLFEEFSALIVGKYIHTTNASYVADEDGTPILDKLMEFVKWMYESGFLAFLIDLFGATMATTTNETNRTEVFTRLFEEIHYAA